MEHGTDILNTVFFHILSLFVQLEHAKVTQTELMRESFRQKQEVTESLKCQEELRERLHEESRAREQLAVELSKAEGEYPAVGY